MGIIISKLWGSNQFTADNITGLTAEEKALLTDNFNVLKQDISKSGERLFILYFEEFPQYKNYFRDFKNKSIDELEGNPLLLAHGTNVMSAIGGIISQLNNPEILVELIKKVGYSHGRRNIKLQAFIDLKVTMGKLLKEKLQNKYSAQVEDVWNRTLDIIAATFETGVQQFLKQKDQD